MWELCLLVVLLVLVLQSTVVSALQLEKDEMETKVGPMAHSSEHQFNSRMCRQLVVRRSKRQTSETHMGAADAQAL
jgi:hypothetical protein